MKAWALALFPGELLDRPYLAIRMGDKTYIFSRMSELAVLREAFRLKPAPAPIVPVILLDVPMPDDPPKNDWLCLSAKEFCWMNYKTKLERSAPVTLEAFSETIKLMNTL